MPKSHPPYPPELRRRLVEMVWAGWSPAELAEEFEPSEQCIRNWVRQADRDAGTRQDGPRRAPRPRNPRVCQPRRPSVPLRLQAQPNRDRCPGKLDMSQVETKEDSTLDPVVAAYLAGIDRSLIRKNLALTVEQRFLQLMELQRFASELRRGVREARAG